ncbi:hypothetical protein ACTMTI_27820 [Nonomuraea sp. H19]|uniref:hypothetical protein n=1 Tax=Nonomuraea sp. H19 TaxID=3452206 RepID=UPI003F893E82
MGVRRAPLMLAAALVALSAAGPAAADPEPPSELTVGPPSVRPPVPPRKVPVDRGGSVPGVKVWRSPDPGVSISARPTGKRRPAPKVAVPGMTIYEGAVCGERVQIGQCPRGVPHLAPRRAAPVPAPAPTPSPTPTPTPTVTSRVHSKPVAPAPRRAHPLKTLLVMVVLVTAIAGTTAVAFGARR